MTQCYGYIRVSTAKQGEKGVSLQEQREAILRYAARNNIQVSRWFEERETAAKRGRPLFTNMLSLLRKGQAHGVILHKIDRGARNLRDWADLVELFDGGITVHCANEGLDLTSRGGRLSADIQAVVAADFIRNLREETKKGMYGRLKQGLYPLPAPVGYLDQGKGKVKVPDPAMAPLVRKAFDLYATGRYNLDRLKPELFRLGLRNRKGGRVTRNGLSTLLNNPFYLGTIRLRRTNEFFPGIHEPLVSKFLFDRVQEVLQGKFSARTQKHEFLYRRLLTCTHCRYSLIGERQKRHIYYRCHTGTCPATCVRQEAVDLALCGELGLLVFDDKEKEHFKKKIASMKINWASQRDADIKAANLRLAQLQDRLNRLTDAFLDGSIEKIVFEERKSGLLMERKQMQDNQVRLEGTSASGPDHLAEFLELAGTAQLLYDTANVEEKREFLKIVTSNRTVDGKKLQLALSNPFQTVANRSKNLYGDPHRDIPRTWDPLLEELTRLNALGQLPLLKAKLDGKPD